MTDPHTYQITRGWPDGSLSIETIEASSVVHEDKHIIFLNGGTVLSIHQDHVVSVRDITVLGPEPGIEVAADVAAVES